MYILIFYSALLEVQLVNIFIFYISDTVICFIFQGPAGTRGPEGRQGEKGTKVTYCKQYRNSMTMSKLTLDH